MKPAHIVLLLAGALGGAVLMKVVERPKPAPPISVAQAQVPAPPAPVVQMPPAEPAPAAPEEAVKPSPWPPAKPAVQRRTPAKARASRHPIPAPSTASAPPVAIARSEPPPEPAPPATPEVPVPEQAPVPIVPPAQIEPEHATPEPPSPQREPHKATLNAGTLLPVRLVDGLSSERNAPGDAFLATLDKELVADGFVIAERGARVEGRVVASDRGGKVQGVAALAVALTRLHLSDGQNVAIRTDSFEKHAEATHGQDAEKVGVGAAIGAAIGAMAGGGKGAAVGAGVGGGAGAGGVLLTRGQSATLPSETRITFRLRASVTATERLAREQAADPRTDPAHMNGR
jgi:hypothetical protein